jgi:D-amino-acid dehydrogenase
MRAEVFDARACVAMESALTGCRELAGGLYAAEDESGDALKFTQRLADLCLKDGVSFRYGLAVESLEAPGGRVAAIHTRGIGGARERIDGEAFVIALGSYSARLVRPLGEHLPIYPVKGYSVTLPLADGARAPQVSLTDESRRIVCSRLGQRLRVAGMAELNGYDLSINRTRCEAILRRTRELFPGLEPAGEVEYWAGLRPATPGNVPIIGRGRPANLFYNTGHGTLGWTLACGSGQAVADIVGGRRPALQFPFRGL